MSEPLIVAQLRTYAARCTELGGVFISSGHVKTLLAHIDALAAEEIGAGMSDKTVRAPVEPLAGPAAWQLPGRQP